MRDASDGQRAGAGDLPAEALRAFRAAHPEARLGAALVRLDGAIAVVSAEITLPSGASAAALGSAEASAPRAVELAESRAVARALAGLAFAVSTAEPAAEPAPAAATPPQPAAEPEAPATAPTPLTTRPPAPKQEPEPAAAPPAPAADPPIEDYSWTAFWNWARGHGYANKADLEQKLGQSITGLSPADVRGLIRERLGLA